MIKEYDYSDIIFKKDNEKIITLVDNLFSDDVWDKNSPPFQTLPNLYEYSECNILFSSFLDSCCAYKNNNLNAKMFRMWCYKDTGLNFFIEKRNRHEELWHDHQQDYVDEGLSGIYYLKNTKKISTEFKGYKIKNPKEFSWYIFPSRLKHRPPKIPFFTKRYTIAADLFFDANYLDK
jgi:hypothetical protein